MKKVILGILFGIILSMSSAYGADYSLSEGFKNYKWGTHISKFTGLEKIPKAEFEIRAEKQLRELREKSGRISEGYRLRSNDANTYANYTFSESEWTFVNDLFAGVRFSKECKNETEYLHFVDSIAKLFQDPGQDGISVNGGKAVEKTWYRGNTVVKCYFDSFGNVSFVHLSFYVPSLYNVDKRDPKGALGFEWGDSRNDIIKTLKKMKLYQYPDETIGNIQLISAEGNFIDIGGEEGILFLRVEKGKLVGIQLILRNNIDKIYNEFLSTLSDKYGGRNKEDKSTYWFIGDTYISLAQVNIAPPQEKIKEMRVRVVYEHLSAARRIIYEEERQRQKTLKNNF